MGNYLCLNGKIIPKKQAVLPVDNRGTLYGDGLFETMRCKGVIPPFFDLHWERLTQGMKLLQMHDVTFTPEYIYDCIKRLLHREKMFLASSIRINVLRKPGGKYTPESTGVDFFIEAFELENENYTLQDKGLKIGIYPDIPKAISPLGQFKNSNALPFVLAGLEAKKQGWSECLVMNSQGYITESVSSNVFFKIDDTLVTPSLSTGCVNGTLRKVMMDLIPAAGFELVEADQITDEILEDADEVFLTNAVAGIKWVVAYQRKRYFYNTSKILMKHLNAYFNEKHRELAENGISDF